MIFQTGLDVLKGVHRNDFRYTKLPGGQWIRLLKLHPGTPSDLVQIDLHTVNLEDHPEYEAISYVWGDSLDKCTITCRDKSLDITTSLFDALFSLRSASEHRILWADAVCINQEDNIEKSVQVNMMGLIYSQSKTVLIWLGKDKANAAEETFSLIADVNGFYEREYAVIPRMITDPHQKLRALRPMPADHALRQRPEWPGVVSLFESPWFERVWILQEAGLAKVAVAILGSASIRLSELVQVAVLLRVRFLTDKVPSVLEPAIGTAAKFDDASRNVLCTFGRSETWLQERPILYDFWKFQNTAEVNLVSVLAAARGFKATDIRDRVFAFLGHPSALRGPVGKPIISANYDMEYGDVCTELAKAVLASEQCLLILAYVEHTSSSDLESNPSWVPIWLKANLPRGGFQRYDASSRNLHSTFKEDIKIVLDSNRLHVNGLMIGEICKNSSQLGTELGQATNPNGNPPVINAVEQCWSVIKPAYENICGPETFKMAPATQAFCATFCEDIYPGLDQLRSDFQGYCIKYCSKECVDDFLFAKFSPDDDDSGDLGRFAPVLTSAFGKRFLLLPNGLFGLGPGLLQKGDLCCVLLGSDVPFIIRPTPEPNQYKLIGYCYVHGAMYGQVIQSWKEGQRELRRIILV